MRVRILRPFPYSHDGITIENLVAGTERDVHDRLADGLIAAGLIALAMDPPPASAPLPAPVETPAEAPVQAPADPPAPVEAPAEAPAETPADTAQETPQADTAGQADDLGHEMKHIGGGRFAIFRDGERVSKPMKREDALAALAELAG